MYLFSLWKIVLQNRCHVIRRSNSLQQNIIIDISVFNQLDAQNLFHNKFYFMPLHVSSICAHHQEVKIALHSLWYHHTYRENHLQLVQRIRTGRATLLPLHSFMDRVRTISPAASKYPDRRYRADWFSVMDVSEQTAVHIFFYCHVEKNIFWKVGNYQSKRRSTAP